MNRWMRLVVVVLVLATVFVAAPAAQTIRALAPGDEISGKLTTVDATLDDGSFYQIYRVSGRRGDRFTVSLRSDRFDTYLIVLDDHNFEEHNDDRADGDTDSEITFSVDQARDFYVLVSTYQPGDSGPYTIRLIREGAGPRPGGSIPTPPFQRSGRLDAADQTLTDGELYESHRFRGEAGTVVRVDVESSEFDTYLILVSPSGDQIENDDARGSTNSAIERVLEESGEYELLVTSYESGERGAYRLSVSSKPLSVAWDPDHPLETRTYEGNLTQTVETLAQGEFVHHYEFQASPGETVEFELSSAEFDAYLILEDEFGTWIEQNDDKDESTLDSRISMILPRGGTYRLLVTTYDGGETGRYVLVSSKRFTEVPSVATITDTRPSRIQPTPDDHGYYGVFVGISDYPGQANDLDFCAEDAANLHQVFLENRYAVGERLTLLRDREATRDRMLSAIRGYGSRVGRDDTLVIFFSGHGDSVRSARERDGNDETIELYDGPIVELAQALDQVQGRVILVLDSCYSAGFAKDVITRPGWFGIFSSEEDVVSYVADEFRSGGYLSHFFQRAISGDADGSVGSGTDGRVSMAELERYLFAQWYGPSGPSEDSNQHLRFERNGVSISEVLFRL
jgi:hypothetical protein